MMAAKNDDPHKSGKKLQAQNLENVSLFHTRALSMSVTTHDILSYEDSY